MSPRIRALYTQPGTCSLWDLWARSLRLRPTSLADFTAACMQHGVQAGNSTREDGVRKPAPPYGGGANGYVQILCMDRARSRVERKGMRSARDDERTALTGAAAQKSPRIGVGRAPRERQGPSVGASGSPVRTLEGVRTGAGDPGSARARACALSRCWAGGRATHHVRRGNRSRQGSEREALRDGGRFSLLTPGPGRGDGGGRTWRRRRGSGRRGPRPR